MPGVKVHLPLHLPVHIELPLQATTSLPGSHFAVTSQLAMTLHCTSQSACACTSARQLKANATRTATPAAIALSTRALRMPQASCAVVLVASSPSARFIL